MSRFGSGRLAIADNIKQGDALLTVVDNTTGYIASRVESTIIAKAGAVLATVSLGDIGGGAYHDEDNQGLDVMSDCDPAGNVVSGGYKWHAIGDEKLGSPEGATTKQMAVAAMKASLAELLVQGAGIGLGGSMGGRAGWGVAKIERSEPRAGVAEPLAPERAVVDFSRYEAMRDAGAMPAEVCRAALQYDLGLIETVLVLRQVFQLSLADAKALTDAEAVTRRAADPNPNVWFHVLAIDPRTRAVALQRTHPAPRELVRKVLARPPAIDRPDLISWGKVTRVEFEELAMSGCLDGGTLEEDMATCPPEQMIWSIFHLER